MRTRTFISPQLTYFKKSFKRMKCPARQRGKSAKGSTFSTTSNKSTGLDISSENLDSASGSSAIDALVRDMASLQTTLAVTTSQLSISSSQLQSKERELERVRGKLRDIESSILNNSCASSSAHIHETSSTHEVFIEKIDSICDALGVKPISTAYEESKQSATHPLSESMTSQTEPLLSLRPSSTVASTAYIDDTISTILKVIEEKSMQISFLTNSLDIINAQLTEERQLSRELANTISRLQQDDSTLSKNPIDILECPSGQIDFDSYLKMTRTELLKELQDKDTQISKLQATLCETTYHTPMGEGCVDKSLSQEPCTGNFAPASHDTLDDTDLTNTVKKFIMEYQAISSAAPATVPHTNRLLDMLLDAIKLRAMSRHKLSSKEIDTDMAVIESSFVLRQMRMKDEEIAKLKKLLQEKDFQLDQVLQRPSKPHDLSQESSIAERLRTGSTPMSSQVQRGTFVGDKCELLLTNHQKSNLKDMNNLGTVVLPDSSSANEAVLISFSARLKKIPVQDVKNYGDPLYKGSGLTIASRVSLGPSCKSTHQTTNLSSSAGDLVPQDLEL